MDFRDLIEEFLRLLATLVPILIALGLLYFFIGMVKYLYAEGDKDKGAGRQTMGWGLVALFAMVSVYGIIRLLEASFL
jgi:hypothetical protein